MSFCAVPDFNRVEPDNASGPTTGLISIVEISAMVEVGLHDRATVVAPISFAYLNPPIT